MPSSAAADPASPRRLARLAEELAEHGAHFDGSAPWHAVALAELDYAMRPHVHERRVPSYGSIVAAAAPPARWEEASQLAITRRDVGEVPLALARRFADGLSSWMLRDATGSDEWAVFDRPAGSERDLVVLADAFGGLVVQRHPQGSVRVADADGVLRWDGRDWHREPPIGAWLDVVGAGIDQDDRVVFETLLTFAVHDLGAWGIGATLVFRADTSRDAGFDERLPSPPPLRVTRPGDLAPLRHVLAQLDGAALFDASGVLIRLGVRLVPTPDAEADVDGYRGTRHTSARRYSYDDPGAIVVVVSEDGPVTVLRGGEVVGTSKGIGTLEP